MKKVALLVGADPQTSEGGPNVKLHEGMWKIVREGQVNSEFCLTLNDTSVDVEQKVDWLVGGMCSVRIAFIKRGTESHISVYAELQDGS